MVCRCFGVDDSVAYLLPLHLQHTHAIPQTNLATGFRKKNIRIRFSSPIVKASNHHGSLLSGHCCMSQRNVLLPPWFAVLQVGQNLHHQVINPDEWKKGECCSHSQVLSVGTGAAPADLHGSPELLFRPNGISPHPDPEPTAHCFMKMMVAFGGMLLQTPAVGPP